MMQAQERIEVDSIIWLRSSTWFEFLAQRLDALQKSYKILYDMAPDNHGILAGLWAYLMQSVLFTPTMVNPYVNQSLAQLQFKKVVDRFGMFFLHDLNLRRKSILKGVLEVDELAVRRILGAPLTKRRAKPEMPKMSAETGFPLGQAPPWEEVKQIIAAEPWKMIKKWTWPEDLEETVSGDPEQMARQAGRLFMLFTIQTWSSLQPAWLNGRDPIIATTARDALSLWTLQGMYRRIKECSFLACNAGLDGAIPGKREERFENRLELYFPEPENQRQVIGSYRAMKTKPGYLGEYWEMVEHSLLEEEREELKEWLRKLLGCCQCLPASTKSQIWSSQGDGLKVVTNPTYYRLNSVGKLGRKRQRKRKMIHFGVRDLKVRILEQSGHNSKVAKAAVRVQSRAEKAWRSGKAKNKRKPPMRKRGEEGPEMEMENDDMEVIRGEQTETVVQVMKDIAAESEEDGTDDIESEEDDTDDMESESTQEEGVDENEDE